jgi:phage terminase large subunit
MENGGWQIFNTTPRGRNHAYTTLEAAKRNPDAFAQILDATQTGIFTPEQLEAELQNYIADFGEDFGRSKFEQEYLCSFDAANLGAILARQLTLAERAGKISDDVQFDPEGQPIQISVDIGRRDTATWWFWQPVIGGYNIVDYDSGFGIDAEEWAHRIHKKLCQYELSGKRNPLGCIWLPHDARTKTFSAKESAIEIFLKFFGHNKCDITPSTSIADRINAARVVVPRVQFNKTNCKIGLDGLRAWSYAYNDITKTFGSSPLHDWASHDGDGFSYGCQIMQMASPLPPPIEEMKGVQVGQTKVSLNDLWKETKTKTNQRY